MNHLPIVPVVKTYVVSLSPAGRSGRVITALTLLILGFGRLGLFPTVTLIATSFSMQVYGILQISAGFSLLLTTPYRAHPLGRAIAALAAILAGGMAWDIKVFSVSMFLLLLLAITCACESLTDRVDD